MVLAGVVNFQNFFYASFYQLQSRQVKRTPLDYINELIISKLNPFVVPNNAFISKMFESKFDC